MHLSGDITKAEHTEHHHAVYQHLERARNIPIFSHFLSPNSSPTKEHLVNQLVPSLTLFNPTATVSLLTLAALAVFLYFYSFH